MKISIFFFAMFLAFSAHAQDPYDPYHTESPKKYHPINASQIQLHAQVINLDEIHQAIGYPESARRQRIEGGVRVMVKVNEKGEYVGHRIANSGGRILDQAVESHLHRLRFRPATLNGRFVASWCQVSVRFRMSNS